MRTLNIMELDGFDLDKVKKGYNNCLDITVPVGVERKDVSLAGDELVKADESFHVKTIYSLLDNVTVIRVPKGVEFSQAIEIYNSSGSECQAYKVVIFAEENSKIKIIDKSNVSESVYFKGKIVEVYAGKGASIDYYSLENSSNCTHSFTIKRGQVELGSSINWVNVVLGGKFTLQHTKTELLGESSKSSKQSVFLAGKDQKFDIDDVTLHKASNTKSVTRNNGVLKDNARTNYSGVVKVEKDARNCVGNQKSENLLLSETVKCNSIPILEVENDEVVCSHGATFTKVNEEKLFYLTSRGVSEDEARNLMVKGFLNPIISCIEDNSLIREIQDLVNKKVEGVEDGSS